MAQRCRNEVKEWRRVERCRNSRGCLDHALGVGVGLYIAILHVRRLPAMAENQSHD
jgi:hypothetical protein